MDPTLLRGLQWVLPPFIFAILSHLNGPLSHFDIAKLLLEKGADQHIKDNYQSRTALDVAKYRQFSDVVGLLLSQGKSAEEAEALLNDKRYIRSDKEIEAEGRKRKVMSGIHWANVHLFLGRYKISKEDVKK